MSQLTDIIKQKLYTVDSVADLASVPNTEQTVLVKGYQVGSSFGGGLFTRSNGRHNGGTFIGLDRSFPSDWSNQTQLDTWFIDSGVDEDGFARILFSELTDYDFGGQFAILAPNHDSMMAAMRKASSKFKVIVKLESAVYRLTDTQLTSEDFVRIIGTVQDNGEYTKVIRSGTEDTWRSCFHVTSSGTFFDKLYLYAADGFSERGGITYGEGAGRGNKIGHVKGSYWRLGVVYPKDTDDSFELSIDKSTAVFEGRAYASACPNTPYGAITIGSTEGIYAGFVDISGGSIDIGEISTRNYYGQAVKKGNEGLGGIINIGKVTAKDGVFDVTLEFNSEEQMEAVALGSTFTGLTSGATGDMGSVSRYRLDLVNVVGTFLVGEEVTNGVVSATVTTVTDRTSSGLDDGIVGNTGTHFDSFTIGTLELDNVAGSLFWVLNNGQFSVDLIKARNLKNIRHLFRYTPNETENNPGFKSSLTLGRVEVDGAVLRSNSTFYPLWMLGEKVKISSLSLTNIEASNGSNFIFASSPLTVGSMEIETTGGNWSRFMILGSSGLSKISNIELSFDSANRIGTVNNGTAILSNGRYTTGTAGFDGTGTAVLNEFSAF